MGETIGQVCPICRGSLPPPAATGRPRIYCRPLCRRIAERRLKAARNWASLGPEMQAMVATDVDVVDLAAADLPPGFKAVSLGVDELNAMMNRMR